MQESNMDRKSSMKDFPALLEYRWVSNKKDAIKLIFKKYIYYDIGTQWRNAAIVFVRTCLQELWSGALALGN